MNDAQLLDRIIEYGADKSGIYDRFAGNAELYAKCFEDLLSEPNLGLLHDAIEAKDYGRAFTAAHALKGLSGNLGVTPFYDAVRMLVESLRANLYDNIDAEYAEVVRQYERLRLIASGEPLAPIETAQPEPVRPEADATGPGKKARRQATRPERDSFITRAIALLLIVLVGVGLLFVRISNNYSTNIKKESAEHLIEISYQLKLYIEERIANDWKVTHSVVNSVTSAGGAESDEAIFRMILEQKSIWQVTDVELHTEDGYGISSDRSVTANDIASDLIVKARAHGEYMSIIDSQITYTVPVETNLTFNGSRIVAVSTVQSMATFLDNMGFSSFDGCAWMYLTDENGIVISRLTNDAALPVFNFQSVLNDRALTPLIGESPDDPMHVASPAAYILSGKTQDEYVVTTPIATATAPMRLFYLAPENVVNETMNGFSRQLVTLSAFVLVVFCILAIVIFLFVYRARKKQFDRALLARERMFDLLVKNTQTAFGLFHVNEETPSYISANSASVIGDAYFVLEKTDDGYRMRNSANTKTSVLAAINESMRGWDGKSGFKSGYILNDKAVPPAWFEIELYPVDGGDIDFVGIAQDVTQLHDREEATRSALDMAERANDAKSHFLSNMSHDIRTPMNAIMNMTHFAMESMDEPRQLAEYLHTIQESADHLLVLINDVLDMSRIESGQLVIESRPFDIVSEMRLQADIARTLCMAKGQTFIANFDSVHTPAVLGDAMKFSQILSNLLGNAVKFTPEHGAVRFSASEIPSLREDIVDIRITIEDTGIGIAPAYLSHIFDPFSRADDRRVSGIEGTGLGLSIVHSYVTAMGGTIQCESEEGEGSVFTVELFFTRADAALSDEAHALTSDVQFLGQRCLVAEDNRTNQLIAKTMLTRLGFLVDVADDGEACVRMFLRSSPGCYDIIYMDIQMPVMNGYQAAKTIRESNHPQAGRIPIVAMTANVFAEDIEKARVAGMDGHLGKPILLFNIIDETNKAMKKRRGTEK